MGNINNIAQNDSVRQDTEVYLEVDTSHNPKIATIFSAILPSSGHIYNQLYKIDGQKNNLWWKLPVIYGGLGAMTYLTIDNNNQFKMFRTERLARLDEFDDKLPNSELEFIGDSQLKVYQDQYERWRNLSVIGGILVYTLQLIDVNVEAHLMHFDTSENLSLQWQPSIFNSGNTASLGLTFRISFK